MIPLVILSFFFLIFTPPLFSKTVELESIQLGNGYLPDDRSLSSVTMVGAHNSSVTKNGWIYYQQDVDLKEQFETYGVRAFKIPMHWYDPQGTLIGQFFSHSKPYIALCHEPDGRTNCQLTRLQRFLAAPEPAVDYLIQLRKLLERHPEEIVILMVESYLSKKSTQNGMAEDPTPQHEHISRLLSKAGLTPLLFQLGDRYKEKEWPTLGYLRDRNQRLVIISNDQKDGLDHVSLYRETAFEYSTAHLLNPAEEKMRGGSRDKQGKSHFFLMNHFTQWSISNDTLQGYFIDLLPDLIPRAMHENLEVVNYDELNAYPLVFSRADRLKGFQGRYPNIILVDFVNQGQDGGVQRAVYELNLLQSE